MSNPQKSAAPKAAPAPKAEKTKTKTDAAAAKRSETVAKKRQERIEKRGYALPLVLTCTVTGKVVKYTSPTYIEKVVAKYGSLDKLRKNFISREGRAQTKPAKAPKATAAATTPAAPATAPAAS